MVKKNEYFELDEFMEDEIVETSNNSTDKKVKEKSSIGSILLKSVLPAGVTLIAGFVLGMMMVPSSSNQPSNQSSAKVSAIKGEATLSAKLNNLSTAQVDAMTQRLAELTKDNKLSTSANAEALLLTGTIMSYQEDILDKLMKEILNEDLKEAEASRISRISEYFNITQTTTDDELNSDKVMQNLKNFLSNGSLAKSLNINTIKAGPIFTSLVSIDKESNATFEVITPVLTADNKIYNVLYTVKMSGKTKGKAIAVTYNGYIAGNADAKTYYENLGNVLKGEINLGTESSSSDLPQNAETEVTNTDTELESENETTSSNFSD